MYISFQPNEVRLTGSLRFSLTTRVYNDVKRYGLNTVLGALSASNVLLIFRRTTTAGEIRYHVHTLTGTYVCAISKDNASLLAIGFQEPKLQDQNDAIKRGVCFLPISRDGIIVQVRNQGDSVYEDYVNGVRDPGKRCQNVDCTATVRMIERILEEYELQRASHEDKPETIQKNGMYQPSRGLQRILELSRQYSELEMSLNELKAQEASPIYYRGIDSVDFDPQRHGNVYTFSVEDVDERVYRAPTQVSLPTRNGEDQMAELLEVVRGEHRVCVKLLFANPVDISQLPTTGAIRMPISSVVEQVQIDANDRILTGKSAAKYMDRVLGNHTSLGFEREQLSDLQHALGREKYPPNASQKEAIFKGITARDALLVMGPPGTGKTTVILWWTKQFINRGMRVLISSQNNKAVDNVLTRLMDEASADIIRIGSASKIDERLHPFMFQNKIRTLRDDILRVSCANLAALKTLYTWWLERGKMLSNYAHSNAQVNSMRAKAQKEMSELVSLRGELLKMLEQNRRIDKTIMETREKKQALSDKLDVHAAADPFRKLLLAIPALVWRHRVRKLEVAEQQACELQMKTAEQYLKDRRAYACRYEQLRSRDYQIMYEAERQRSEVLGDLLHSHIPEENIWRFFRGISFTQKTLEQPDVLLAAIKDDLERCEELKEILQCWYAEIINSVNVSLNECVLESVNIVGATCIGVNSQRRFSNLHFDVSIIDEAGQIQVHNALVPMSVSDKLLMLGDHKQIPPSMDEKMAALCEQNGISTELLSKSLFEYMYERMPESNKIMLDTQYRIPAEIADVISSWFYSGEYKSFPDKRGMRGPYPAISEYPFLIIDTHGEWDRFEHSIKDAGSNNPLEASIVCEIVQAIIRSVAEELRVEALNEIGIISAYKMQVELIRHELEGIVQGVSSVDQMVATLDSFQGQERDIILYSFTKSSRIPPDQKRIGFLNELRRLNVAMSRGKKMLVMIGDMEFLAGCSYQNVDETGRVVYEKSEKQFSDFICKILEAAERGKNCEKISAQTFRKRISRMSYRQ